MPKTQAIQIEYVDSEGNRTLGPLFVPSRRIRRDRKFKHEQWTEPETVRRFVKYIHTRDTEGLEAIIKPLDRLGLWNVAFNGLLQNDRTPTEQCGISLVQFWQAHGLSSIPQGLRENLPLLVDALKKFVRYEGGTAVTLYRGELRDRYENGICGIAWTTNIEIARMFARRRPSLREGAGIVLKVDADAPVVVACLGRYSQSLSHESEYILDPRILHNVTVIESH